MNRQFNTIKYNSKQLSCGPIEMFKSVNLTINYQYATYLIEKGTYNLQPVYNLHVFEDDLQF